MLPGSGWASLPKGGRGVVRGETGKRKQIMVGTALPGPAPGPRHFGAGTHRGMCVVRILSSHPAPSQWALHCPFTDGETEAWRDATGSLEPPPRVPALGLPEGHSVGAGRETAPCPASGQGGRCSGNSFLQRQAPPHSRSRSWLQAHPPALPFHPLSLPGRASGPYITQQRQ